MGFVPGKCRVSAMSQFSGELHVFMSTQSGEYMGCLSKGTVNMYVYVPAYGGRGLQLIGALFYFMLQ